MKNIASELGPVNSTLLALQDLLPFRILPVGLAQAKARRLPQSLGVYWRL
jgi:hypothetical protein